MQIKTTDRYTQFANTASRMCGRPKVFFLAVFFVAIWLLTGPFFHFSDTWQLIVNTVSSVVTFLMVFLIQNEQNRDTKAIQLKLDELIRATQGAHNALLDLEQDEDETLEDFRKRYKAIAAAARDELRKGKPDTDSPDA